MSERFSSWQKIEAKQITEAEKIGNDALTIIDRTYGSGYPHWESGSCELAYHNGHHGRSVGKAAVKVCSRLGLLEVEQAVARMAGRAHDLVQLKGRGIDEAESAQWLDQAMERSTIFPEHLRHMGTSAILGTLPIFKGGVLVDQQANHLNYLTKEAELVAKSVACGDLESLYIPESPYLSHQLFRETQGMLPPKDLSMDKLTAFQSNQIALLENYKYPLKEGGQVLATHKKPVVQHAHTVLKKLKEGMFESWEDVINYDLEFLRKNS